MLTDKLRRITQTQTEIATKALVRKREALQQKPLDRLLSMQQTAELLGVHLATIRRLIEQKKLVAVRVANRAIRIRVSSIEAHVKSREIDAGQFTA
jgi:excisionase family DNA binding protein